MDKTTKTFIWVIGIIAIIAVIANWRRIFPNASKLTGGGTSGRYGDEDTNPVDRNGKTVCKVVNQNGEVVEIEGDASNPDFQRLCRDANRRDPYRLWWGNTWYWPYYYYFVVKPKPNTGTGTGTGTGNGGPGGGTQTMV